MRDHSTPVWQELLANGAETIAITPGAASVPGQFQITGIAPMTSNGLRNYIQGFWVNLSISFDPDAAGAAVNFDALYKGVAGIRLTSPFLGDIFADGHTRGAVLGHIIQVLALGYNYPQPARTQIPASTDVVVPLELFYWLPLSYEVLKKPHETAQWAGYFDNGSLTVTVAASTIFDTDYAGSVTTGATLRAKAEFFPSPDAFVGFPCQWREREITGGGQSPVLQAIGMETQLQGVVQGCGLAGLFWLAGPDSATGTGLSGPDGVDNITSVELPFRSQKLLRNLDGYFLNTRRAAGHRVGPIAGSGAAGVALHDSGGWPYTMGSTVNGRPSASATAMFLPFILPGKDFETSKAQRIQGNHTVTMNTTTPVSASHRFVTWEFMEFSADKITQLGFAMLGNDLPNYQPNRKALGDNLVPDAGKLRYTRTVFERKAAA